MRKPYLLVPTIVVTFMVSISLFYSSCKSDLPAQEEDIPSQIIGPWKIYKAFRNGNQTKSLEKGRFVFSDDNSVETNLFGGTKILDYSYKEMKLKLSGEQSIDFTIDYIQNDSMILKTNLNTFDIDLYLIKADSLILVQ